MRDEILTRGLNPERALALAEALAAEGRELEAVDAFQTANRLRRSPAVERRLVRLRRSAFAAIERPACPPEWPPVAAEAGAPAEAATAPRAVGELAPSSSGPPVLRASELTLAALRSGILHHGCVLVRGLVPESRARRLAEGVDRAFAACDALRSGSPLRRTTPWYDPLEDVPDGDYLRQYVRGENCLLMGDSPSAFYEFVETLHEVGLDRLIASHLGARPSVSLQKCCLRRADPAQTGNAWHQDGAFLGAGLRTLNTWISLSPSGRTAPGLDIVPRRIDRLLPVGTPGALYGWDVAEEVVRAAYPDGPFWRPEFEPGDALLFDDLCLHRTALEPSMTEKRWAIESWFFAPTGYPEKLTPLVV